MKFFSRLLVIPALLVGFSFLAPTGHAQETDPDAPTGEMLERENSWKSITIYSYKRSSGTVTNEHYGAVTTDISKPGALIFCTDGRMSARLSMGPLDLFENIEDKTRRARVIQVKLFRDGELADTSRWFFLPEFMAINTQKHSQAAKIFNAVVKNQMVSFETSSHEMITLDLPPMDDGFRDMVKKCGL